MLSCNTLLRQQQCRCCPHTGVQQLQSVPRADTLASVVSPQYAALGRTIVIRRVADATCLALQSTATRRHSAAIVWAAKNMQASKPEEAEHYAFELEELEDEWEDEYDDEFEEAEYNGTEEGPAERQDTSAAAAAAAGAAAGAARNVKQIPAAQESVQYTPDDFVDVGYVSRAHGIKGEVRVVLITDEPKKRLGASGRRLWLQRSVQGKGGTAATAAAGSDAVLQRVTVQWGRQARPASTDRAAEWAVKFNEVPNRDKAETLAGCKLLLAACDREKVPRSRDEFFITDLVGLKALEAQTQQLMGIVTEVYDNNGSYNLLRVRLAPNEADIKQSKFRSILVPFVKDMVPVVDLTAGQLQLQLPEGLLETATTKKLRRPYTLEQQAQLREQLKRRQQPQQ